MLLVAGIHYIGEHLLPGKIGNTFVILSFIGALFASASYFNAAQSDEIKSISWKKLGRIGFRLHSLAVIGIMSTLFFMIFNHYFEYYYVWEHSNKKMPMRYVLSCFWEGQEGSFLLWTFWQVVIGNILIRTAKNWEAPVMTIISLVQGFLASMLLGIFIYEAKIGSNPFTQLLRNNPQFGNIPLFQNANYLKFLDGRGLNPLLQNYWMTIHPPTLFLGFSSTVVPFAYAISGLWKKKYTEWQAPAIPWAFFGIMILGTGILMGGAWAYESLSFGGFWHWDPVENSSLIPWLILVGAGHVLLVYKNKKQSLISTFVLSILAFILVLYSTFLTRSGILGKTSVHAFTDLGMSGQLLVYLLFFIGLAAYLLSINKQLRLIYLGLIAVTFVATIPFSYTLHISKLTIDHTSVGLILFIVYSITFPIIGLSKYFPLGKIPEEAIWSREFWMFIGALVMMISCFQIITTTSIPVTNKIFGLNTAPPTDVVQNYNRWQVPFAFLVTLLIAVGQFFKYKNTDIKKFFRKISLSLVVAIVLTTVFAFVISMKNPFFLMLLFSSIFAATANLDYMIRVVKGNINNSGASIAHIGFALIILGALVSTSKEDVISVNTSGKSLVGLGKDFSGQTNILLTQGDTLQMGHYYVTYIGKEKKGVNVYFKVKYFTKDQQGKYHYKFTLQPLVQTNPQMGNVAEPDTRHYLTKDIYTHITYAALNDIKKENPGDIYTTPKNNVLAVGDTMFSSNAIIVLDSLDTRVDKKKYDLGDSDIAVGAILKAYDVNNKVYRAEPIYVIRKNSIQPIDATINKLGLKFSFWKIYPDTHKVKISVAEKKSNSKDFVVMEAIVFPFINVLWCGCIIMVIGTTIAMRDRIKKSLRNKKK